MYYKSAKVWYKGYRGQVVYYRVYGGKSGVCGEVEVDFNFVN